MSVITFTMTLRRAGGRKCATRFNDCCSSCIFWKVSICFDDQIRSFSAMKYACAFKSVQGWLPEEGDVTQVSSTTAPGQPSCSGEALFSRASCSKDGVELLTFAVTSSSSSLLRTDSDSGPSSIVLPIELRIFCVYVHAPWCALPYSDE